MGFWPDWWPANPIGSAWDETAKTVDQWKWVIYAIFALVAVLIIVYFYRQVKK